jgi:hypothetical protein
LGLHVLSGEGAPVAGYPGIGSVIRDELSRPLWAQSRGFEQKSNWAGFPTNFGALQWLCHSDARQVFDLPILI